MSAAPDPAVAIRVLLARRAPGATICPSEVARALATEEADWRSAMPAVHAAVDHMLACGEIGVSWKGRRLGMRAGPYRISKHG